VVVHVNSAIAYGVLIVMVLYIGRKRSFASHKTAMVVPLIPMPGIGPTAVINRRDLVTLKRAFRSYIIMKAKPAVGA
jgi:hypothetical protein